jgi:hypothetical protein
MNRQPKISRREQQSFIRDEAIALLHFAIRTCPCNGVGCATCNNKMKYFDDPVPIRGAITSGMNTKKKEGQFPTIREGSYTLLVEPRYRVSSGDRVTPFRMREFELSDEKLPVSDPFLTYIPINPRNVQISFINPGGGVINYKYPKDFTIEKEFYGRVPLFSKQIKWVINPPTGQEHFSARYEYYPDFEVGEIPVANMSQGQRLIQNLPLKKITVAGQKKTKSYEQSSDALRGLQWQ